MARAPRYFVRVDTYWQNSADYFVGPFDSRAAAQAAIDAIPTSANAWLASSSCGGDIRDAVRVYDTILTATEARARGMNETGNENYETNVLPRIPTDAYQLHALASPYDYEADDSGAYVYA